MALKSHIKGVHEGIKNFTCNVCDKSFSLHQSLKAHIKYYHETNGEGNKCDLCNKTFTLPGTLKAHIQEVHEDIRAYHCPYCDDKAFKRSFDLKKHLKKVHQNNDGKVNNTKTYECKFCEKKFGLLESMKNHLRNCHEEKLSKEENYNQIEDHNNDDPDLGRGGSKNLKNSEQKEIVK